MMMQNPLEAVDLVQNLMTKGEQPNTAILFAREHIQQTQLNRCQHTRPVEQSEDKNDYLIITIIILLYSMQAFIRVGNSITLQIVSNKKVWLAIYVVSKHVLFGSRISWHKIMLSCLFWTMLATYTILNHRSSG